MKNKNVVFIFVSLVIFSSCQLVFQDLGPVSLGITDPGNSLVNSPAPSGSGKIVLSVPGKEDTVYPFDVASKNLELRVPHGRGLKLTAFLNYPGGTTNFIREKTGSVVFDFLPGETKNLSISTWVSGTPIIVPDAINGRLVQLEDMSGNGWQSFISSQLATLDTTYSTGKLEVVGIDFDQNGNLYFADYNNNSGFFKMSSITGANLTQFGKAAYIIYALAIDRPRDLLYFIASTGALHVFNINTGIINPTPVVPATFNIGKQSGYYYETTGILPGAGLAVGDDGEVYFTGNGVFSTVTHPYLARINPLDPPTSFTDSRFKYVLTDTASGGSYMNNGTLPIRYSNGLKFKDGALFVTGVNRSNSTQSTGTFPMASGLLKLLPSQLTTPASDMSSAQLFHYGTYLDQTSLVTQPLWGPRQFAAFYGRKLVILDQTQVGGTGLTLYNRLVAVDPGTGAIENNYGTSGSGTGQFNFLRSLYSC